jgi:hypothetical protein
MAASIKKSGTNLYLALTAETFDNLYCGQVRTPAPPAQAPLVGVTVACFGVIVQSSDTNQQGSYVYVGNQSQGCVIELTPGNSVIIPINDLEKIYVRGSAANLLVNFLAMT